MIYFIQSGDSGPIKIGFTSKDDVKARMNSLQTASVETLHVIGIMEGTQEQERKLHAFFHAYRIRGEWFTPHPKLLAYIMGLILGKAPDDLPNLTDIGFSVFSIDDYLGQIDATILTQALANSNGSIKNAAVQVGLTFRQMRYRMAKYNIQKPKQGVTNHE